MLTFWDISTVTFSMCFYLFLFFVCVFICFYWILFFHIFSHFFLNIFYFFIFSPIFSYFPTTCSVHTCSVPTRVYKWELNHTWSPYSQNWTACMACWIVWWMNRSVTTDGNTECSECRILLHLASIIQALVPWSAVPGWARILSPTGRWWCLSA